MIHTTHVETRWIIRRDLPSVLQIENAQFEYPWSEEDFIACLRQRNAVGVVGVINGVIVGYMIYKLHSLRITLDNIAVHPDYTRRGIGSALLHRLKGKLIQQGRRCILAHVSERNLAAQLFFKANGFRCVSVDRRCYNNTDGEALVFRWLAIGNE